jgi:hypothetical protein
MMMKPITNTPMIYINYINIYIYMKVLLLLIILFIFFIYKYKENFEVNSDIYSVCHNQHNNMYNNYNISKNIIKPHDEGFYSYLLTEGGARRTKKFLSAPLCRKNLEFKNDYFINNKIQDINNENNMLPLEDPFYKYSNVNDNYRLIYEEESVKAMFAKAHEKNEKEIMKRDQRGDHSQE